MGVYFFKRVAGQTESKSSTLFTADAETILVWMRFFTDIFHISFSLLTSLSILMLNFTELMAADDYLKLNSVKARACKCLLNE